MSFGRTVGEIESSLSLGSGRKVVGCHSLLADHFFGVWGVKEGRKFRGHSGAGGRMWSAVPNRVDNVTEVGFVSKDR